MLIMRGRLHLTFDIDLPQNITKADIEASYILEDDWQ